MAHIPLQESAVDIGESQGFEVPAEDRFREPFQGIPEVAEFTGARHTVYDNAVADAFLL